MERQKYYANEKLHVMDKMCTCDYHYIDDYYDAMYIIVYI